VVGSIKFMDGLRMKVMAKLAGKGKGCKVIGINIPLGLFSYFTKEYLITL